MAQYAKLTQEVGDRATELMKPAQDFTVELVSSVSEAVEAVIPSVPLPEFVPSAKEIIDSSFELAEKLLGAQRAYVGRLLDAVSPVTSKFEAETPKPKVAKTTAAA